MRATPLLATFALAIAGVGLSSAPAAAQRVSTDYRCTGLLEQARVAAAAETDAGKMNRAQRAIATGRTLCAASAEGEAARQFRVALRILGTTEIAPATPTDIATTNATNGGN
jgi:hypothetical protein